MAVLDKHHCTAWKMPTSQLKSKWRQEKRNQDHTRNQDLCSIAEFQACEPPIPLMVLVICTELCWHGNSMNVQISNGLDQNPIQKIVFLWHSWYSTMQWHLPLPHCFKERGFPVASNWSMHGELLWQFLPPCPKHFKGLQWMEHKLNAVCSHGYIGMPIHDID